MCFALLWLADRCHATVPGSPLLTKNSPQDCFLDAQTLSGSSPYRKKKSRTSATLSFWQGQKDLPCASHSYVSPTVAVQQYPALLSSLKTVHRTVFLTLRPSRVQVLILLQKQKTDTIRHPFCFWQGQKDLPRASHSYGSPTVAVQQYPALLSSLKTVHRTVFLTLRPSRVQVLILLQKQKTDTIRHPFCFWQGQKDLNPRHVVLETTALPTELYPYIKLVGHQGLEPRTDRL